MKLTKDNTHRFWDSKITFWIMFIYFNYTLHLLQSNRKKKFDAVDITSQVHFTQVTDST